MAEDTISITEVSQRRYTSRLLYAALSLAGVTALFMLFLSMFASHLVHDERFSLLRDLDEYSATSPGLRSVWLNSLQRYLSLAR